MHNNRFNNRNSRFRFLFIIPIIALLSLLVMLLWNAIVPSVLHTGTVNYWQSAGLLILCKILFGGFGPMGRGMHRGGQPHLREKFMRMTTEEREKLKAEWQQRGWQRRGRNDR